MKADWNWELSNKPESGSAFSDLSPKAQFEFLLSVSYCTKVFLQMFYIFSCNLGLPSIEGISTFVKLLEGGLICFLEFEQPMLPNKFWDLILLADSGSRLSISVLIFFLLWLPSNIIRFLRPSFDFEWSKFVVFGKSAFSELLLDEKICLIFWDSINFWSFFN